MQQKQSICDKNSHQARNGREYPQSVRMFVWKEILALTSHLMVKICMAKI